MLALFTNTSGRVKLLYLLLRIAFRLFLTFYAYAFPKLAVFVRFGFFGLNWSLAFLILFTAVMQFITYRKHIGKAPNQYL